jgi:single-strand DNA-binding protein
MASLNKVFLLGNLTRDPEQRYTPSGLAVTRLGLAVNTRVKQGEEWKDQACFIDVVVFGKQAESCNEYLSKGSGVLIEGRLQWRSWESEDGQKRSKHEVIAERVQFMPKREKTSIDDFEAPPEGMAPPEEDDIPF